VSTSESTLRGVIRGVIHQKLRLELIQHAGYLVMGMVMGLRRVFMPFFDGSR
jgi:hypothetical protein